MFLGNVSHFGNHDEKRRVLSSSSFCRDVCRRILLVRVHHFNMQLSRVFPILIPKPSPLFISFSTRPVLSGLNTHHHVHVLWRKERNTHRGREKKWWKISKIPFLSFSRSRSPSPFTSLPFRRDVWLKIPIFLFSRSHRPSALSNS